MLEHPLQRSYRSKRALIAASLVIALAVGVVSLARAYFLSTPVPTQQLEVDSAASYSPFPFNPPPQVRGAQAPVNDPVGVWGRKIESSVGVAPVIGLWLELTANDRRQIGELHADGTYGGTFAFPVEVADYQLLPGRHIVYGLNEHLWGYDGTAAGILTTDQARIVSAAFEASQKQIYYLRLDKNNVVHIGLRNARGSHSEVGVIQGPLVAPRIVHVDKSRERVIIQAVGTESFQPVCLSFDLVTKQSNSAVCTRVTRSSSGKTYYVQEDALFEYTYKTNTVRRVISLPAGTLIDFAVRDNNLAVVVQDDISARILVYKVNSGQLQREFATTAAGSPVQVGFLTPDRVALIVQTEFGQQLYYAVPITAVSTSAASTSSGEVEVSGWQQVQLVECTNSCTLRFITDNEI